MKNDNIVTINGQKFDTSTGLPVGKPTPITKPNVARKPTSATGIHSLTQKSKTLYRRATLKPAEHTTPQLRKVGRNMDIARSKNISHFATRPASHHAKPASAKGQADIGPLKHPLAAKVETIRAQAKPVVSTPALAKSAKTIKEEAIAEAFRKLSEKQQETRNIFKRKAMFIKRLCILFSIIVLIIVCYAIYVSIPSLSVRVASAQAGINATYPEYHPDGYRLDGPVSYSDGQVTMTFQANTGSSKFIIKQSKSSWDSTAVKNQVDKDSNGEFITTEERGLTIYTYNGNAAWVNGGILYTITGDAPLSGDQIRRIATSL